MKHYAGIDVSLNSSSVCVVDESGKIVREVKVPSEPVATKKSIFDFDVNFVQPLLGALGSLLIGLCFSFQL